jgi:hypothetical protein
MNLYSLRTDIFYCIDAVLEKAISNEDLYFELSIAYFDNRDSTNNIAELALSLTRQELE